MLLVAASSLLELALEALLGVALIAHLVAAELSVVVPRSLVHLRIVGEHRSVEVPLVGRVL